MFGAATAVLLVVVVVTQLPIPVNGNGLASYNAPSLQGQVATLSLQLAGNTSKVKSLNSQIETLQSQVSADNAQISQLQSSSSSSSSEVATLQAEVSADSAQIQSLQSQASSDQTQIANLQTEISTLNAIVNLQNSQSLESNYVVQLSSQYSALTWSYLEPYSGYIVISYSSTQNVHYEFEAGNVVMTSPSASFGNSIVFPIVGGTSYTVILHNDSCGPFGCSAVSVTETITYIY